MWWQLSREQSALRLSGGTTSVGLADYLDAPVCGYVKPRPL